MIPSEFVFLLAETMLYRCKRTPSGALDMAHVQAALAREDGIQFFAVWEDGGVTFGPIGIPDRLPHYVSCVDCGKPTTKPMCLQCRATKTWQSRLKCLRCEEHKVAGNGRYCIGCVIDAHDSDRTNGADRTIVDFIAARNGRTDVVEGRERDIVEVMLVADDCTRRCNETSPYGQRYDNGKWCCQPHSILAVINHRNEAGILDAKHPDGMLTAGDVAFVPFFHYDRMRWCVVRSERQGAIFAKKLVTGNYQRTNGTVWIPVQYVWLSEGDVLIVTDQEDDAGCDVIVREPQDFWHRMEEAMDLAHRWREEWRRVQQDALIDGWGDERTTELAAAALGIEVDIILAAREAHVGRTPARRTEDTSD